MSASAISTRPKLYLVREDSEAESYYEDIIPKLSDRKYVVPASNELGQSWPVGASVMLDENRMMEELIESKVISAWKTKADFIRWAIHEGLKQIRHEVPFVTREMGRVEALIEYINHEERRSQFLKMLDKVDRSVQSWIDLGAIEEARRLVSNIGERVRSEFSGEADAWLRGEIEKRLGKYKGLFTE